MKGAFWFAGMALLAVGLGLTLSHFGMPTWMAVTAGATISFGFGFILGGCAPGE